MSSLQYLVLERTVDTTPHTPPIPVTARPASKVRHKPQLIMINASYWNFPLPLVSKAKDTVDMPPSSAALRLSLHAFPWHPCRSRPKHEGCTDTQHSDPTMTVMNAIATCGVPRAAQIPSLNLPVRAFPLRASACRVEAVELEDE
jgi:hypothetical protein